jgi:hypothetical protein
VGPRAVEACDEGDTAGVVLERRVVEALSLQGLVIAPSPDGGSPGARYSLVGVGLDEEPTSARENARPR